MDSSPNRSATDGAGALSGTPPLLLAVFLLLLALFALPWLFLGLVVHAWLHRRLGGWLHWKVRFGLWLVVLLLCGWPLYQALQHGPLTPLLAEEVGTYVQAIKLRQGQLAAYPLGTLWTSTWAVWQHTWLLVGVTGFFRELSTQSRPASTISTQLFAERRKRARALERLRQQAKKRAAQPNRIPPAVQGQPVIGIPLDEEDDDEKEVP